ncbi:putative bifunctional diguanylate cyclase/phosphodiesterase [Novosphingobium lentum]|uniref:putative bifunctional diguanylate cyclase/phosphodiesterase n=1 Tax=Novosphingobium lentum TaxID=145287 RepID=UPI0009FBF364|nr:EAL domain-containing protein [Novosphingobium lentum]
MVQQPQTDCQASEPEHRIGRAEKDIVALGVVVAAIILFVGTGSAVMTDLVRAYLGAGIQADRLLGNALILNIALIIFGWRRYVELTREVGDRRKAEETASRLAQTDPLTGCLNRRSIGPATAAMLADAQRQGTAVVVMMIDLDKFKRINDIHGHQSGDDILIESTRRIRAMLPERALLARLGGDEFACVVPIDRAHSEHVENLASLLNEGIASPIQSGSLELDVTVSIGLARSDELLSGVDEEAAQQLLHMADIAMYQAKKGGRNRYYWFEASMEKELRFRSELEAGIRAGIPAGEFVPYYEKQIDLEDGRITGFEMLARWNSPAHGMISPEVFIPIAEEIGCISELSETLIAQALRDAREWDPSLTLSVNISPVQLRDPWFAQKLLKLLISANFPPSRLDIEITESCLHENVGVVRSLITSLKNQGIGISLDDFGTGYSSLAQLRTLPFDRIKIDRTFVSTLGSSKESSTIIEAISSLGRGMDLPITAEGIENKEVLALLKTFGTFKGQGFLYGQPESGEAVRRMLAEQNLLAIAPVPGGPTTPDLLAPLRTATGS